jgi:hypothetical protein
MTGRSCSECAAPMVRWGSVCDECRQADRAQRMLGPLPAREPVPAGMPFCGSCGALRNLATFGGVPTCADCMRGAA